MIHKIKAMVTLAVDIEVDAGSPQEAVHEVEAIDVAALFSRDAIVVPRQRVSRTNGGQVYIHSLIVKEHSQLKKAADKEPVKA